jgi:DNA-binding transcriptional MerR regulator
VRAIHHYEDVGLLKPHKRSKGRYRLYARDAIERVRWIHKLHDLGMTLGEIQEIVSTWERAPSAPEAMAAIRAVYHDRLQEVRKQVARLTSLERELAASLQYLDTCETCDPTELVAACSSCTVHEPHEHEPDLVAGLHACCSAAEAHS